MSHSTAPSIDLTEIAKQSMRERQLLVDFSSEAKREVDQLKASPPPNFTRVKDLRHYLWFSLDNAESKDLDQVTFAETIDNQHFKIYIAIADVDSLVKKNSAIDLCAQHNTTSVYTPTKIFPMLPEQLSTDLTSLNENADRLALIVEVDVLIDGSLSQYAVYPGYIRNHAKLAYHSISAWLDGIKPPPQPIKQNSDLESQVRLQDYIAKLLRQKRYDEGALTLQTIEPRAIIRKDKILDIVTIIKNRGHDLIEDFMIAANRSTASFLQEHQVPSLRRVVRVPKRWDRIVAIAHELGEKLPPQPEAKALNAFLNRQRLLDPLRFPDLSLTVIKLLGNGEYVVEYPGKKAEGHFGLAVKDYTHSTAPNRRYPDLITQRLIKSVFENRGSPYNNPELESLAQHCTQKEDDANKVERKMRKSAACLFLSPKLYQEFDALVTGAAPKGTWVRILQPPVEGKLVKGFEKVDVGDRIRVQLVHVDVEKGFIDFIRV
jgi:exoribonuclease-2